MSSKVSCVTKDFGKLVPQLDKHTQSETLSVLRLCPHGGLPLGWTVAVHAAKIVNTKPSIRSLTGSMKLQQQHRQALLKCHSLCEAAPLCASVICYPAGL